MNHTLLFLTFLFASFSWGQNLSVSEEIMNELHSVEIEADSNTYLLRVSYPKNYDASKTYKCFLGLAGGGQSLEIVNYCYAAWFRSGYFEDYITVLPVSKSDSTNFKEYNENEIEELLMGINNSFKLEPSWVIAGTSNGGIAAFNFVAAFPKWFEGIIVVPGLLSDRTELTKNWNHLKVILAYGDKDDKTWIKSVKKSARRLKSSVYSVEKIPLKGQGHILSVDFNVDKFYDPYFLKRKK